MGTMDHHRSSPSKGSNKKSTRRVVSSIVKVVVLLCLFFLGYRCIQYGNKLDKILQSSPAEAATGTKSTQASIIESPGTHHCLNKDFQHVHKTSIWTMLNDNPAYIESALKLGRALIKHTTKTDFDLVAMTLSTKPLSDESMAKLAEVGFVNCAVDPIRPTHLEGKTRKNLTEKFGVLHVFAMTIYDTVLFLDADTYVQGPIDDLLQMDLEGKAIGVTKDIRAGQWVDTFNTGVMLLHPSLDRYSNLLKTLMDESFEFEYIMSDQGFLNAVYENNWHEIGFLNNANLALYRFQREFWDQHKLEDIRIIHYTMQKPWKCNASGPYGPICKVWIDGE